LFKKAPFDAKMAFPYKCIRGSIKTHMVFQKNQGALSKNVSQIFYVRSYNDVSKETIIFTRCLGPWSSTHPEMTFIFKVLRFMLIQA
jgi:hypothetical protein